MSGFGVVTGNNAQLRSYIDNGNGFNIYSGEVLEFKPCTKLVGWLRVPSLSHKLNIFINGIQSNPAFTITQKGKQIDFIFNDDISKFKNTFIIQLEITQP